MVVCYIAFIKVDAVFQYDCKLNLRMDHTSKDYRLNNSNNSNNLNNLNNLNLILQAEIGKSTESKTKKAEEELVEKY